MPRRFVHADPETVVVLGASVAGLEAVMALRYFAGSRAEITVVAPDARFQLQALEPLATFGLTRPVAHDVAAIARAHDAAFVRDAAVAVDTAARRVRLASGAELGWQRLVVAIGARPAAPAEHGMTATPARMRRIVRELHAGMLAGSVRSVAFVVPPRVSWTLPAYELALMLRREARAHGATVAITIISTESSPLAIFGPEVSRTIAGVLADARIAFDGDAYAEVRRDGSVLVRPHARVHHPDRVASLPRLEGPALPGLPHDRDGFLITDASARVLGRPGVWAAGDCTAFPLKQGGLAAQQADAAAADIARRLGAHVRAERFLPLLRGRLIVGSEVTSMRHRVGGGAGEGRSSTQGWWGPHAKLSARFLTPELERGHDDAVPAELEDVALAPRPTA